MNRLAALSRGTKLLLAGGVLLFVDLFLTWQTKALDFGRKAEVTASLDGWDFWGLVIGLLTLAVLALVVARETGTELFEDERWDLVPLMLTALALLCVLVKNARDADSAWASYAGVVLALAMVVGAVMDWSYRRAEQTSANALWYLRATASQDQPPPQREAPSGEQRPRW